jgi:hypothetical protein
MDAPHTRRVQTAAVQPRTAAPDPQSRRPGAPGARRGRALRQEHVEHAARLAGQLGKRVLRCQRGLRRGECRLAGRRDLHAHQQHRGAVACRAAAQEPVSAVQCLSLRELHAQVSARARHWRDRNHTISLHDTGNTHAHSTLEPQDLGTCTPASCVSEPCHSPEPARAPRMPRVVWRAAHTRACSGPLQSAGRACAAVVEERHIPRGRHDRQEARQRPRALRELHLATRAHGAREQPSVQQETWSCFCDSGILACDLQTSPHALQRGPPALFRIQAGLPSCHGPDFRVAAEAKGGACSARHSSIRRRAWKMRSLGSSPM